MDLAHIPKAEDANAERENAGDHDQCRCKAVCHEGDTKWHGPRAELNGKDVVAEHSHREQGRADHDNAKAGNRDNALGLNIAPEDCCDRCKCQRNQHRKGENKQIV